MLCRITTCAAIVAAVTPLVAAQESRPVPAAPAHLSGAASGAFATQPWNGEGRLTAGAYVAERVRFASQGVEVIGNAFVPHTGGRHPAVVLIGPVAFVKEQSPVQYASRLAQHGFVALAFDPRHHGESGGEPRRVESGAAKVQDLRAAIDYLVRRPDVDAARVFVVAVCQGVNWGIDAAVADGRVRGLALVAGHYLVPETARLYLGSDEEVSVRLARAAAAREKFERTGAVDYIPVVSMTDPTALLTARPIYEFYARWADRGPFWNFHGLWENRIAAMSEADIWGHRVDASLPKLATPTLMVHADRAASGPEIPRKLFEIIPASNKRLAWLPGRNQLQFYEDPLTIDAVVPEVVRFFADLAR